MNLDTIILGVASLLFAVALIALLVWAFRTFFGKSSGSARRAPEKRLAVVELAAVDAKRTLYLLRRDDVEHLVMIGGPVDVVVETGIKWRPQPKPQPLGPPHDDVIIAKTEAPPRPDYSKS
jgi:flagellar protein FliO/FliZ